MIKMKVLRKSPVIEAFLFNEESIKHPEDWPTWLYRAASNIKNSKNYWYFENTKSGIKHILVTDVGLQITLNYGDYILYDNGELFALSSPAFHANWSEVL